MNPITAAALAWAVLVFGTVAMESSYTEPGLYDKAVAA